MFVEVFDAILPAGGRIDGQLADATGVTCKAMIRFQGETLLQRTIRCLRDTGRISKIVVIGPPEVLEHCRDQADILVPELSTGPQNIKAGLDALEGAAKRLVVVTTDLPFISSRAILDFLQKSPEDADIFVPCVTKRAYCKTFPNSDSTFLALKGDEWTAGGIYVLRAAALRSAMPMIETLFENRKSKLGMAKLLGPTLLLKFLTRSLTIDDVERKAMQLLRLKGKADREAAPELAYDLDALDDYQYAIKYEGAAS